MKLFLSLLSAALFFGSSAQALTLVCKMTHYGGNTFFNAEELKNWFPEGQTHVFDIRPKTVHFKETGFDGKLDHLKKDRIHWRYNPEIKDKSGRRYNASYRYVFLRKKKKLIPIIQLYPGAVVDTNLHDYEVDGVSGTCDERP